MIADSELKHVSAQTQMIAQWFEAMTATSLASIDQVYAEQAHFCDPFNDVRGRQAITAIYAHMFENLTEPRFVITEIIEQDNRIFMSWRFLFQWRAQSFDIPGGTRFRIDEQGLIADHQDYWDVAQGLYEKLPVLGWLLRRLRQRMATPLKSLT
jgi:steroid Delta-isomerase